MTVPFHSQSGRLPRWCVEGFSKRKATAQGTQGKLSTLPLQSMPEATCCVFCCVMLYRCQGLAKVCKVRHVQVVSYARCMHGCGAALQGPSATVPVILAVILPHAWYQSDIHCGSVQKDPAWQPHIHTHTANLPNTTHTHTLLRPLAHPMGNIP